MPSITFQNLKQSKQLNIKKALLKEFSQHTLAEAQVARIVADAGVARGTFYKYFPDLIDAYQWLLRTVMKELALHPGKLVQGDGTASEYQEAVIALMGRIQESKYDDFLRMYYEANEGFLAAQDVEHKPMVKLSCQQWAVMVLCHQAIKECLIDQQQQSLIVERLGEALRKIIGG